MFKVGIKMFITSGLQKLRFPYEKALQDGQGVKMVMVFPPPPLIFNFALSRTSSEGRKP